VRVVVAVALACLVGACGMPNAPTALAPDGPPTTAVTTTTRAATFPQSPYRYVTSGTGTVVVKARTANGNERQFFWLNGSPAVSDSTSCAEWRSGTGLAQQGAAFRITDVAGVVRGLTITRNIWARAFWMFNFHWWDTSIPGVYKPFHSTNLTRYLRRAVTYPLWFCARVTGREIQFVVWKAGTRRPAWGSTTQGGSSRIPPAFGSTPGMTGWYVGHVPDGSSVVFDRLAVDGVAARTTSGLDSVHL